MCTDTGDIARSNRWKMMARFVTQTVIGKQRGRVPVNPFEESSNLGGIIEGKSIYSQAVSVLSLSPKVAYPDSKKNHVSTFWITTDVGPNVSVYKEREKGKTKKLLSLKTHLKLLCKNVC
jgi:hypothetical protein